MPHKDPQKQKAYHRRYMREIWYPKNRRKHIANVNKLKTRIRTFIEQYKKDKYCVDCGYSGSTYPQVLDFDHIGDKSFTIGAWMKSVLNLERIKEEMSKCELVCANCHRIRTFKRLENKLKEK